MAKTPANSEKPVVWYYGAVKSPPFTKAGRLEAGLLLGLLQNGEMPGFPAARPMPSIGPRCGELRVRDEEHNWRIMYRADPDAVLVVEVFAKKTGKTPKSAIDICKARLKQYDKTKN
jgi:phage-related protein